MPGEREKPCIDVFAHAAKTCHATLRWEGKVMKHAPDATQVRRGPSVPALLGLLSPATNVNLDSSRSESDWQGFQVDICWATQDVTSRGVVK